MSEDQVYLERRKELDKGHQKRHLDEIINRLTESYSDGEYEGLTFHAGEIQYCTSTYHVTCTLAYAEKSVDVVISIQLTDSVLTTSVYKASEEPNSQNTMVEALYRQGVNEYVCTRAECMFSDETAEVFWDAYQTKLRSNPRNVALSELAENMVDKSDKRLQVIYSDTAVGLKLVNGDATAKAYYTDDKSDDVVVDITLNKITPEQAIQIAKILS